MFIIRGSVSALSVAIAILLSALLVQGQEASSSLSLPGQKVEDDGVWSRVQLVGHNLSATGYIPSRGSCLLGIQVLACSINDETLLGTSPWLLQDYQMASLHVRRRIAAAEGWATTYQGSYFQTLGRRDPASLQWSPYDMQALWNVFVFSQQTSSHVFVHLNQHLNYYFREEAPFSLRRPSLETSPWQVNSSILIEARMNDGFSLQGEMGLLDWLRPPIHYHIGASLGQRLGNLEWHGGFSFTATADSFSSDSRLDGRKRLNNAWGPDTADWSHGLDDLDFSVHPEFAISYIF